MPFDSQQFLQELQAIMQQQRPPRPDSYSAADSAVQIHPYMEGKEPRHAFPTFLDDHQVILFGGGIRIFDTQKGKFVQTISRLRNAEIALSPTKSKIFLANATAKDVVVCILYERIDGVFTEKHRTSIKGVNTDGGTPCFSSDENTRISARISTACGAIRLKTGRARASTSANMPTSFSIWMCTPTSCSSW